MWRLEVCAVRVMQELIRALDERWICCGSAARDFSCDLPQPDQFSTKLLDDKREHPHSFVECMPNFIFYGSQCFLFARKFGFQKLLSTAKLFEDRCGRGLPGKRHPCEKWRTIALISAKRIVELLMRQ